MRMKIGGATMKNSTEVSQKLKSKTLMWSSNSASGYLSKKKKKKKKHAKKDRGIPMFIAALFTRAKIRKQVSVNRWVDENKHTNT